MILSKRYYLGILQNNLINKVCSDCEKLYVGKTKRYKKNLIRNTKIVSHQKIWKMPIKQLSRNYKFVETSVVDKQEIYKKRMIQKMVNIRKHKNSMNKNNISITSTYVNIIYSFRVLEWRNCENIHTRTIVFIQNDWNF